MRARRARWFFDDLDPATDQALDEAIAIYRDLGVEIVEIDLPDNAAEDSYSLLPLLTGADQPVRETSVSCSINGVPSLRVGSWKYIAAPGSGGWGKGGDQSQPLQLYDLSKDLSEANNLAAAEPERVQTMQQTLEEIITRGRSTPGQRQSNDLRVIRHPKTQSR